MCPCKMLIFFLSISTRQHELYFSSSVRSLRSIPPVSCMQGYQQPPQATPVHPTIQALHHTVLPPPQQPNVFSRPEVITSRRIGPTAVIVSKNY